MGNKVVPLALQTSWQPCSHKQKRQQGHFSLRARAQHKGSRQWTSPADDYSRFIISGPITSSPLNTEMGTYKQFRWKVPAPCKQKNISPAINQPWLKSALHTQSFHPLLAGFQRGSHERSHVSADTLVSPRADAGDCEGCTQTHLDCSTAGASTLPPAAWLLAK